MKIKNPNLQSVAWMSNQNNHKHLVRSRCKYQNVYHSLIVFVQGKDGKGHFKFQHKLEEQQSRCTSLWKYNTSSYNTSMIEKTSTTLN